MHNTVIIIMMFNILESYQESKSLKFSSQRKKKKVCEFIDVKQTYCNNFVVCTYTKSLWYSLSFCSFIFNYKGEGDGTPLQYSCLENPKDGGDW